jgi:hypothetical protein
VSGEEGGRKKEEGQRVSGEGKNRGRGTHKVRLESAGSFEDGTEAEQ